MIEGMTYTPMDQHIYSYEADLEQQIQQQIPANNLASSQLKNSSKKQSPETKLIKQLKSRDIKLSHKKIQILPNKTKSVIKNVSSLQNEKQVIPDQISMTQKQFQSQELKRSLKNRNLDNSQKPKDRQKVISQSISTFNPESIIFSKQSSVRNRQKFQKKLKAQEITHIQQRVRQSRSQSKRQKLSNSNFHKNNLKNALSNFENQNSIFQSIDIFGKQNSNHSLDKNHLSSQAGINFPVNLKLQEKLHLPSLVKNKLQTNIDHHETEIQKSHFYPEGVSKTQKSSPFIQKIIKIPIDRLKPLKPEQIKLKYQQKVKQEQKNRAKQRAIQIFQKQEEQMRRNNSYDLQSDENTPYEAQQKKFQNQNLIQIRNKTSMIKKQKLLSNNRGQNIFKKNLHAYNGIAQH